MVRRSVVRAVVGTAVFVCALCGTAAPAGLMNTGQAIADARAPAGTILGTVWDAQGQPVPDALVRLRNLTSGRIRAMTRANSAGRFRFANVERGSYVLELVNDDDRVIALSQTFTVAPGETVATFVRMAARLPWFLEFFNNAAATVVSSAASIGVTAVAPTGQPVSGTK